MPPQQLCCRRVTRQRHKMSRCDTAAPHTARACRVTLFMLPDAHSWRGLLPPLSCPPCTAAVDAIQRAALRGTLRVFGYHCRKRTCSKRLLLFLLQASSRAACVISGGFHAASQVLLRSHAHRVVPSLTRSRNWRAIAGRSCFALRFCHVRRKACVAAPSMMYPAQQRVAHCVDDCFRMNTP